MEGRPSTLPTGSHLQGQRRAQGSKRREKAEAENPEASSEPLTTALLSSSRAGNAADLALTPLENASLHADSSLQTTAARRPGLRRIKDGRFPGGPTRAAASEGDEVEQSGMTVRAAKQHRQGRRAREGLQAGEEGIVFCPGTVERGFGSAQVSSEGAGGYCSAPFPTAKEVKRVRDDSLCAVLR